MKYVTFCKISFFLVVMWKFLSLSLSHTVYQYCFFFLSLSQSTNTGFFFSAKDGWWVWRLGPPCGGLPWPSLEHRGCGGTTCQLLAFVQHVCSLYIIAIFFFYWFFFDNAHLNGTVVLRHQHVENIIYILCCYCGFWECTSSTCFHMSIFPFFFFFFLWFDGNSFGM